jgi:phosphinothricin acetyltransferase
MPKTPRLQIFFSINYGQVDIVVKKQKVYFNSELYCIMVRHAVPTDLKAITDIYNHYVLHTVITFEEEPVAIDDMLQRVTEVQARYPWLVYEQDNNVVGYAYASKWKPRAAYRNTVETSIYLNPLCTGKGIGKLLYTALLEELKPTNIHAVIGGVALPNDASIRLHETLGYKKIGQFMEVGYKFEKWVDVGYWQLILR